MRDIICGLLAIAAILFGLYMGIVWGFIGGITFGIQAWQAGDTYGVAWAVFRVLYSEAIGIISGGIGVAIAAMIWAD